MMKTENTSPSNRIISQKIRVRFAPSPSGLLHVGSARIALINYLYALIHKGTLVLRIEDTDSERSNQQHVLKMLDTLHWLGIQWEEGPFFQSQRKQYYELYRDNLLSEGKAYPCFCSRTKLQKKKEIMAQQGGDMVYDGTCRDLSPQKRNQYLQEGRPYAVRLKIKQELIKINDLIKGQISFHSQSIGDIILFRDDGTATYNFAVVVDDALMHISHVIRGEDHLSNTPKQCALYRALDFAEPQFAHIPLVLGPDKTKLSKRHGETSIEEFQQKGICAEALLSYLYHFGYASSSNNECIDKASMMEDFNISAISRSPSIFDDKKLYWINSQWLRRLDLKKLYEYVKPFVADIALSEDNKEKIIALSRHQALTLADFSTILAPFYTYPLSSPLPQKHKLLFEKENLRFIESFFKSVGKTKNFLAPELENEFNKRWQQSNLKKKDLIQLIRYISTGQWISPPLFDTLEVLGRIELIRRYTIFKRKYDEEEKT